MPWQARAREIATCSIFRNVWNVVPVRPAAGSRQEAVTTLKRGLIERSLSHVQGNQNQAAGLLPMSRQAPAYQIRELGIMVRA